ncbi:hypothetical protein E2986_13619 [Frieseomelitta varia]|uniref:Uncharacterized protein n=1 Tax=Frieseomelitta varia TaxID=561572 RepID=A0A833VM63_9HYME|nr:hypothetical protein E2986_13619 [Frieseomelitta varia]
MHGETCSKRIKWTRLPATNTKKWKHCVCPTSSSFRRKSSRVKRRHLLLRHVDRIPRDSTLSCYPSSFDNGYTNI